jgi:hypothetical protein
MSFRSLGLLILGSGLAGCAAVSQDVRDYYRQMAYNYKAAQDKAKIEEGSLENVSRMLLATGDTANYRKTQRRLERVRSWEGRCAKQEERFDKAAAWMEAHFDVKTSGPGTKAPSRRPDEAGGEPGPADVSGPRMP